MTPPTRDLIRGLPRGPADLRRTAGIEKATRGLLLGGIMPLWLGAGLADWYLHRRTRIEQTAGPRESALHSLMLAETGIPVLLGLFCEVNAGVLATAAGAVAAHSATAYWDQAYAEPRRRTTPLEQQVHSLLEVSPVMATFLLTALHWDQAKALAGQDRQPPQFGLLSVADGQAVTTCAPSRNSAFYQDFLRLEEQANPDGIIYVITDNLSSHDSKSTRAWLEGHPRIRHAFIPEKACWLNLQEAWRRIFRRQALAGQDFADPDEIAYATRMATAQLNARARPWVWGRPEPRHRYHRRRFVYIL